MSIRIRESARPGAASADDRPAEPLRAARADQADGVQLLKTQRHVKGTALAALDAGHDLDHDLDHDQDPVALDIADRTAAAPGPRLCAPAACPRMG
jgi:hypothetical protein